MTSLPGAATASVRTALEADIECLAELYGDAVSELRVMRGGRVLIGLNGREGSIESSFRRQLADPGELVVMGLLHREADRTADAVGHDPVRDAVGYGTCRLLELTGGERLGSIGDLYVDPTARRNGVGRAMADRMVSWCMEQGCTGVDANALPGSRAVKSFFEAGSFTARVLVMHRALPGTAGP